MNLQPIQVTQAQEYTQPTLTTFQSVLNNARETKENVMRMQEFKLRAQQQLNDQLFNQGSQLQMNEVKFDQQMQQLQFRDRMNHGIQDRIDVRDGLNRGVREEHNKKTETISGLNYLLAKEKHEYAKKRDILEDGYTEQEIANAANLSGTITDAQITMLPSATGIKLPEGKIEHIQNVDRSKGTVDIRLAGKDGQVIKDVNVYKVLSLIEEREVLKKELSGLKDIWSRQIQNINLDVASLGISTSGEILYTGGAIDVSSKRGRDGKYYLSSSERYELLNKALASDIAVQTWLRDNGGKIASELEVGNRELNNFMQALNDSKTNIFTGIRDKTIAKVFEEVKADKDMPSDVKTEILNSISIVRGVVESIDPDYINKPIKDINLFNVNEGTATLNEQGFPTF